MSVCVLPVPVDRPKIARVQTTQNYRQSHTQCTRTLCINNEAELEEREMQTWGRECKFLGPNIFTDGFCDLGRRIFDCESLWEGGGGGDEMEELLLLLNVGGHERHSVHKQHNPGDYAERAEGQSRVDIEGGLKTDECWDGFLGHQIIKRLYSLLLHSIHRPSYLQTILFSGFKNSYKKSAKQENSRIFMKNIL